MTVEDKIIIRDNGTLGLNSSGQVAIFGIGDCGCCSGDQWCTSVCQCLTLTCGVDEVPVPQCVKVSWVDEWETTQVTLKLAQVTTFAGGSVYHYAGTYWMTKDGDDNNVPGHGFDEPLLDGCLYKIGMSVRLDTLGNIRVQGAYGRSEYFASTLLCDGGTQTIALTIYYAAGSITVEVDTPLDRNRARSMVCNRNHLCASSTVPLQTIIGDATDALVSWPALKDWLLNHSDLPTSGFGIPSYVNLNQTLHEDLYVYYRHGYLQTTNSVVLSSHLLRPVIMDLNDNSLVYSGSITFGCYSVTGFAGIVLTNGGIPVRMGFPVGLGGITFLGYPILTIQKYTFGSGGNVQDDPVLSRSIPDILNTDDTGQWPLVSHGGGSPPPPTAIPIILTGEYVVNFSVETSLHDNNVMKITVTGNGDTDISYRARTSVDCNIGSLRIAHGPLYSFLTYPPAVSLPVGMKDFVVSTDATRSMFRLRCAEMTLIYDEQFSSGGLPLPAVENWAFKFNTATSLYPTVLGGTLPYFFEVVAGRLPTGMTLDATLGVISGTPSVRGSRGGVVIACTDAYGEVFESDTYTWTVDGVRLSVEYPSPISDAGVVPATFEWTLRHNVSTTITPVLINATLPMTAFAIFGGAVPTGMSFSTVTGVISGTPTVINETGRITITGTDSSPQTIPSLSYDWIVLVFSIAYPFPYNTTNAIVPVLPIHWTFFQGDSASIAVTVVGGSTPIAYSAVGLPDGLTINASTGLISGTVAATGDSFGTATITAVDNNNAVSIVSYEWTRQLTFSIDYPDYHNQGGVVFGIYEWVIWCEIGDNPYSDFSIFPIVTGGVLPITYTLLSGSVPVSGALEPTTGEVYGIGYIATSGTCQVRATDALGTVADSPVFDWVTQLVPSGVFTIAYNSLPYSNTGVGPSGGFDLRFDVSAFPAEPPFAILNVTATNGVAPITYAITAGFLPGSLALNTSTGAITGGGAPYGSGDSTGSVTITGTDATANTASTTIDWEYFGV